MVDRISFRRSPHLTVVAQTLLCLLTAACLLLALPNFNFYFLAPLALAPILVVSAKTSNAAQRFALGWSAGVFFWFFLCTWIQFVLQQHGGMGLLGSVACFLLFSAFKGIHMGVFALLSGPLMNRIWGPTAVAALWTGLERTHATFGFAWLDLGNAGIDMALPLRLAPIVGVYGPSFVFALLGASTAVLLLRQPRTRLIPILFLPLLWLLPPIRQDFSARQRALVVQPNIDPGLQWTGLAQQKAEERLSLLSHVLPARLIIWPELPAPLYFYDDRAFHQIAMNVARQGDYFLFGTVAYTRAHQPLNSAVLLRPDGTEVGRYDKINLVPFGEFVPSFFSFVNRITSEAGDFVPGHDIKVLAAGPGLRLGVFICYESAFPDLVRQFAARGANVLVNLSNDAYFGHSEAREQHLALVRMRAVETRRYVIRATNDGITAVIDPAGRISKELPRYQELAAAVSYGTVSETTFYSRHGDWFAWSCLLVGLGLSAMSITRPRQLGTVPHSEPITASRSN